MLNLRARRADVPKKVIAQRGHKKRGPIEEAAQNFGIIESLHAFDNDRWGHTARCAHCDEAVTST